MDQEKDARHNVTHSPDISSWWRCVGGAELVAQRWLALVVIVCAGECRVPRTAARIRGCVVEAGRESSAENESCGPGSLLDVDCWTTTAC